MSSSRKRKANTSLDNNIVNKFEERFHQDLGQHIIDDVYLPPPPIQPLFSADQTGKRFLIENIELFNFKSYGGTRFLGPFHKSFNSIVGLNGGDKSNVIDAIVFIFGFRAQNISSVTHNSESLPNCDTGRVTVNFVMIDDKGGDNHKLIDDTRFSISRIVHKGDSSYYQIDGRRVPFKEVTKKLQDFGIDLRYNRFLILQGEVEQISLMKPISETGSDVGMLEYLEDIVGTSRFKEPIEKLILINNTLNEQRTKCYNRMKLCQRKLKVIGESKDEAVRALELENMIKIEKYKINQCKAYRLIKKMEKDENELSAETAKMDAMVKEEQEIDQKKPELENEEKSRRKENEKLKKNLAEFKEKYAECEKNDYYLTKKRNYTKDKLKKLTEQIEKDSKKLDKLLDDEPTIENDDVEQFENEKVEIAEELKTVFESIIVKTETVYAESADLIQKRDKLDRDLMKFKDEQTDKLNRMNEAHNILTIYKQKSDNARFKVEQLATKLKRISDETEEKEIFIERYQNEIPQESKKLEDFHTNLFDLELKHSSFAWSPTWPFRTERKQLDIQIENLRLDSHNLEKDIQILKDKMNSYRLDVKDNERRVQQCRDNLEQQKLELEQIQDNPEIEKAEVLYQKAKKIYERELAKMDSKQDELKRVDEKMRERLNQKLEPIKKKKKSLEKKLKDIQSKLIQILSKRKTKELAMKKMEDTLEQNQMAKVGFEEEVESVKAQIVELEEFAKDICARYQKATEKSQSFEKEFNEIQKQVRELCERVRQIKSEKLDLKHEMEKKVMVLNEKRQHLAAYRHELNSIVLKEIDDLKDEVVEDLMNNSNSGTAEQEHLMEVDGDNQQTNNDVEEGIEESGGDAATAAASIGGDNSTTNKNSKLPRLTADELEVLEIDSIEKTIATLEAELQKLSPKFAAIEEYRKKRSDYRQRVSELVATTQQRDTYMDHVKSTKDKRLKEFKIGLTTINKKLKELYRKITTGGDADLEFVNSMDPFSEGINFTVRPNQKSWKNSINLSGGEKTLASLALIFALNYFKPSPFYIIDAALDFKNVSIILDYIEKHSRNTQFLIIKSIPFDPAAYRSQTNGLTNGQLSSQQSRRSTNAGFTTGTTFSQLSSQSSQCDSEQNSIIPSATNGVVTTTITQSSMDVDEY